MYFANVQYIHDRLRKYVAAAGQYSEAGGLPLQYLLLDMSPVTHIDSTGALLLLCGIASMIAGECFGRRCKHVLVAAASPSGPMPVTQSDNTSCGNLQGTSAPLLPHHLSCGCPT
eukprot:GHRQ01038812.1.p2 GENE.GHRQ01038812.1~~GHRQ01038812.1.p2  ORF type:complete len:115 (-),score=29.92 GHRQ01038812.1:361-705(-)